MSDLLPGVEICKWKNDAPFAYSMTYDEGTVDALASALPVHEQFGFPGHLDVVAGQIGQVRNCFGSSLNGYVHLSADELKYMVGKGWGIGNHSWSHYVYPCHPGLDLYREVVWSKYRLEDMLGQPIRIFTIPNDKFNYAPVIDLVKQHYLACCYVEGAPNREGFDLHKIGNFMVASGKIRPRPGWPEELLTENLSLAYLRGSWLYETSHLVAWNVPQAHKCTTPESLTARFRKLTDISGGKLWAATPDDVIDYELLRRHLSIENIRQEEGKLVFDVNGSWPIGVVNGTVTLKVTGSGWRHAPQVSRRFHQVDDVEGPTMLDRVQSIVHKDGDWLVSLQLTPWQTIVLQEGEAQ